MKKTEDNKTDAKIPNSLIIYLKTRIPNFYKINYEPYMTVPTTKSHTVYFDPLVKYYTAPIHNIPPGAPKEALFTQFFEASEFDSMINRILSDFRYMQKPRTFQEAYDQGVIRDNMTITLKTLFKNNSLFYINKKPYTIVGTKFNAADWQIDKKPIDKLLNQFSHLTSQQIEEEANAEEDDIPEVLRQGTIAAAELTNQENVSAVASGLQNVIDNPPVVPDMNDTDAFVTQDSLPGVSDDIKRLYTEYLRQNVPINYSDIPDLARDPLTLSILINPADLLAFINANKKSNIVELYSGVINAKVNLETADKTYIKTSTELAVYKTKFNASIKQLEGKLTTNENIQQLMQLKIEYMQFIFKLADAIKQIYEMQKTYFVSLKALLEELQKEYVNIIKYYKTPRLAIDCIKTDIYIIDLLLTRDPENPYSESYHSNLNNFNYFYENRLYKERDELMNPQVNYAEEILKYTEQPNLAVIESEQFDIYNFKMFLFYSYNQYDIWLLIFKTMDTFIRFVSVETVSAIQIADNAQQELNKEFSDVEQQEVISRLQVDGIQATLNKNRLEWFLVNKQGEKAIKDDKDASFEKLYLEYMKASVDAYDSIILYTYLLEIICLRQSRVYVAEENVNQLNLEYSITLDKYYKLLLESGAKYIPDSFLWDTSALKDVTFLRKRKEVNDKAYIIYKGRIRSITDSRNELVESCEAISKLITPNVSKQGFIDECNNMIASSLASITPYTFKSSYWLEKTVEKYDIQSSNDFVYNMNRVVKDAWYDRVIEDMDTKYYMDWMVYDNDGDTTFESLFSAVADGLNRQLEAGDNETTNPYTELVDGKSIFTLKSLDTLVTEMNDSVYNVDITRMDNVCWILQKTLKIKLLIFEMYNRGATNIVIGDMVLYNNKPHRVTNIDSGNMCDLYNGYTEIKDVPISEIEIDRKNLLQNFRMFCGYDHHEEDEEYSDYMYLLVQKKENIFKIQLVQHIDQPFVFQEVPIYISYFIYNSCPNVRIGAAKKMGLKQLEVVLSGFETQRRRRIESEHIEQDIISIQDNIDKYKKEYNRLKNIKKKSLEQQAEKLLLKEEIKDLKERKAYLLQLKQTTVMSGGEIPYATPYVYPTPTAYNYTTPSPYFYPQQNPNMMFRNYYNQNYIVPYNISQNKAKDQKSKLSFYITVELELFPGTSANTLQKNAVKCQSTFERIREAWADIFGYQYRPAVMADAYTYMNTSNKDNKDNNTNKEKRNTVKRNTINTNKTRKTIKKN